MRWACPSVCLCPLVCLSPKSKITRFSQKLSNLEELWSLLMTYKKLQGLFKEPIIGPLKSKMAEICHLKNWQDVMFCHGQSDLVKLSPTAAIWSKSKPKVYFKYGRRLFFKSRNIYIWTANWVVTTKLGLLIEKWHPKKRDINRSETGSEIAPAAAAVLKTGITSYLLRGWTDLDEISQWHAEYGDMVKIET